MGCPTSHYDSTFVQQQASVRNKKYCRRGTETEKKFRSNATFPDTGRKSDIQTAAMRVIVFLPFLLFSLLTVHGSNGPNNDSKFEFSKSVYKVKGTIRKSDSDYVIVAEEDKKLRFAPSYLPEEYKKNGLEVTFDGELGKADASSTALNIHKIWVAYEIKEKYKLIHKSYDLN